MLERACRSMAGPLQQQSEPLVGGVDRQGLLMVQLFVCYKLSGWTVDKSIEVWYVGYVRVLAHQALQQAVDWRKQLRAAAQQLRQSGQCCFRRQHHPGLGHHQLHL